MGENCGERGRNCSLRQMVYLALVHHPTVNRQGAVVTTAVTTLDLHDLCRLATTYGLGGVYATTPLDGQRELVSSLLQHWLVGSGGKINPSRREALGALRMAPSLRDVVCDVALRWDDAPEVVGTSARVEEGRVSFSEARRRLAETSRPAVLVFGTGWGLAPKAIEDCDWLLEPIAGFGDYNHLSVRSAASIVVDRLFGG